MKAITNFIIEKLNKINSKNSQVVNDDIYFLFPLLKKLTLKLNHQIPEYRVIFKETNSEGYIIDNLDDLYNYLKDDLKKMKITTTDELNSYCLLFKFNYEKYKYYSIDKLKEILESKSIWSSIRDDILIGLNKEEKLNILNYRESNK